MSLWCNLVALKTKCQGDGAHAATFLVNIFIGQKKVWVQIPTGSSMSHFYGSIAKRPNAADCKSVPEGSVVRIYLGPPYTNIAQLGERLP